MPAIADGERLADPFRDIAKSIQREGAAGAEGKYRYG